MTTRIVREAKAIYAALDDKEALKRGPIFIEKDGKPEAVLLSIEAYLELTAQQEFDEWRREQLSRTQVDHDAFERMLPELLKEHRGEWVAIHQGQVVSISKHFGELVQQVRDSGHQTFYIQRIQESLRVIELPFEVIGRA